MQRVLVTGMGAFCPLGQDMQSTFNAALAAQSAVSHASPDILKWLPNVLTACCKTDPETLLPKQFSGMDRATQFALLATSEATSQAGFASHPEDADRIGVYVGVGFGGGHIVDTLYTRFYNNLSDPAQAGKNPTVMHPLSVPRMMANAAAAAISMQYGLKGPSNTYTIACASSAVAIGEAYRAIRHGYIDAAVVLGTEAMLNAGSLMAWNALRVMAKPDVSDASRSCTPFSAARSGFVLGEGAAALVLESAERVARRNSEGLAEVAGFGCSSDAQHLTAPSVQGQARAMQQAMAEAGLAPEQVGYINAHGTATQAGDVVETQSIKAAFGAAAATVAVSSTKAVHGHLIGAAGALEFALSIMALRSGSIPPTAHLEKPDPQCDLDYVPKVARHGCDLQAVMSNSFAFGGSNAVLLARKA